MSSFYKNALNQEKALNFSIDFLLIVIIFINKYFDFLHNIAIYIKNFIIIWLVISYIFGRFHNEEKIKKSFFLTFF